MGVRTTSFVNGLLHGLHLGIGPLYLLTQPTVQGMHVVYSTTISSRCRGMNPCMTTQVSMQRNIRLFLSQPCSFVRMTWPITAMLQGAVLLQTSHAWAIRPQFAQACIWQMCRARQLSSQCRAQQYGPDTLTSSFIWPRSVIGPLRLGCPSTCLANQDSSGSSALSIPDSLSVSLAICRPGC